MLVKNICIAATALCDHDRDDGDLRETEPLVHTQVIRNYFLPCK